MNLIIIMSKIIKTNAPHMVIVYNNQIFSNSFGLLTVGNNVSDRFITVGNNVSDRFITVGNNVSDRFIMKLFNKTK
jgi:hypothetical protein